MWAPSSWCDAREHIRFHVCTTLNHIRFRYYIYLPILYAFAVRLKHTCRRTLYVYMACVCVLWNVHEHAMALWRLFRRTVRWHILFCSTPPLSRSSLAWLLIVRFANTVCLHRIFDGTCGICTGIFVSFGNIVDSTKRCDGVLHTLGCLINIIRRHIGSKNTELEVKRWEQHKKMSYTVVTQKAS